jgi:hypothetical protein
MFPGVLYLPMIDAGIVVRKRPKSKRGKANGLWIFPYWE